ncbi:MAG: aminoglycoside phosphotransferase [Anaerocolumna sp.]|jgi:aminoglycoside phosphotransferase (APT) family kinase protein|nr:aminoglycoside phosphotransferase [Anaerocolumna sp.]
MEASTKNRQSIEIIEKMIEKAFGTVQIKVLEELKEGYFNIAYLVKLSDGREMILKIAPPVDALVMSYEKNIMFSEVDSMNMVLKSTDIPVAQILYYDNSHTLCESDYFFMSKLVGSSLSSIMTSLDEESKSHINFLMGQYNYRLNEIIGGKFGYYGLPNKQGDNWFNVFKGMILTILEDSKVFAIDFRIDINKMLFYLDQDKAIFEEVDKPRFIHWDLWEGNIFIEENTITGLIDFERCLWGDELMEYGFRIHAQNKDFIKGYGISSFTDNQKRRIIWYDIYLFLIMALECDYRNYETRDAYNWSTDTLIKRMEELSV